jgi:hypothetical protein
MATISGPLSADSAGRNVSSMTSQGFTCVVIVISPSWAALKSSTICSSTSPSASVYPCQKVSSTGPSESAEESPPEQAARVSARQTGATRRAGVRFIAWCPFGKSPHTTL